MFGLFCLTSLLFCVSVCLFIQEGGLPLLIIIYVLSNCFCPIIEGYLLEYCYTLSSIILFFLITSCVYFICCVLERNKKVSVIFDFTIVVKGLIRTVEKLKILGKLLFSRPVVGCVFWYFLVQVHVHGNWYSWIINRCFELWWVWQNHGKWP